MNLFKEVFIANLKELYRDKSGLFWLMVFPIIVVFIFGMIFTGSSSDQTFSIGLVSMGDTPLNNSITETISNIDIFQVSIGDENNEVNALESGNRDLVLIIPELKIERDKSFDIEILYKKDLIGTANVLISSIKEVFFNIERDITNRQEIFRINSEPVITESLNNFDYILPGVLAMAIMHLGLFGSFQFLDLREKGIIRGLGVTPLPREVILGSEIFMRLVISIIQTLFIILIGRWVFGVKLVSGLPIVFGIVVLGAITFISLGYMLITFVNSVEGGQGLIQIVQFPMLFLSGIFFPHEFIPDYIKPIVNILPLTYLGHALREIMVGFASPVSMRNIILILLTWIAITIILTVKFWKWE